MQQLSRRRKREIIAMITAAIVGLVAYSAIAIAPAHAAATLLSQGKPATASSTENADVPGVGRGRRQHRHALVERVLRPAVAAGRPGRHGQRQPGRAATGRRRTRQRSRSRSPPTASTWTSDLLHHHRHRRHADAEHHRLRPLRADVRHRPGDRRTATRCGSSRCTARSRRHQLRHGQRGTGPSRPPRRRPRTRRSRRRTRSTATPEPAGRARSPTRSGCRSTSAPPRASAR